ncbi:MAG TPA: trypsin-like peptidase domain-containing protein [Candidatus Dormibacteraeota bacterium]|nr:trypsin-like peptidase domain-containing protein [Candidatus Dormibacteraeota bacterium]
MGDTGPGGWQGPPPPSDQWHHPRPVPPIAPRGPSGGGGRGQPLIVTLAAVVAAVVVLSAAVGCYWLLEQRGFVPPPPHRSDTIQLVPQSVAAGGRADSKGVAASLDPVLVDIGVEITGGNGQVAAEGAGTGIIVTSDGDVLTNNHVVDEASTIKVYLNGKGVGHPASVIGIDPSADVALIHVDGLSGLPSATLADTSTLKVGESVVALGNAGGRGGPPSVSEGRITGLNRSVGAQTETGTLEHLTNMIQSNAPIQAGDSGGALVNAAGQVVGMITAGESGPQPNTTVGFAVPMGKAVPIADQIHSREGSADVIIGEIGYLGVQVQDPTTSMAHSLGLKTTSGALIVSFTQGSAAASAGIPEHALIVAVDGRTVTSVDTLGAALLHTRPGQVVTVYWLDRGGRHTSRVTLGSGPPA